MFIVVLVILLVSLLLSAHLDKLMVSRKQDLFPFDLDKARIRWDREDSGRQDSQTF